MLTRAQVFCIGHSKRINFLFFSVYPISSNSSKVNSQNSLRFMQASEIVKANNLADKIVVIHGRVEVRFCHHIYSLL
jgi:hypothetical protein